MVSYVPPVLIAAILLLVLFVADIIATLGSLHQLQRGKPSTVDLTETVGRR